MLTFLITAVVVRDAVRAAVAAVEVRAVAVIVEILVTAVVHVAAVVHAARVIAAPGVVAVVAAVEILVLVDAPVPVQVRAAHVHHRAASQAMVLLRGRVPIARATAGAADEIHDLCLTGFYDLSI